MLKGAILFAVQPPYTRLRERERERERESSWTAPLCLFMSMSCAATLAPFSAPSTTSSGEPTNVYTVLLADAPGSTSRREHPSVEAIAWAIASITSLFWPSEKFGTHSTILAMLPLQHVPATQPNFDGPIVSHSADSRVFHSSETGSKRKRSHFGPAAGFLIGDREDAESHQAKVYESTTNVNGPRWLRGPRKPAVLSLFQ